MHKEEYLKILNDTFKDFKFFEYDHHYEYKGKKIGISVTKLIEEYSNEFDSDLIAPLVAKKRGISVKEVLEEWKYKNEFSTSKGTTCHNYVQSLWNGEEYKYDEFDDSEEYKDAVKKIKQQADNFYIDYHDFIEHIADEFVIGSKEYDIASAVDHLFRNKQTNGLILMDYKTNSDIHKNEKHAKNMKAPLRHLKDTTLNHYILQLSIYKYIIEKYSGLKIENMFIVHMSENNDNYDVIMVDYLKEEVEKVLSWRLYE